MADTENVQRVKAFFERWGTSYEELCASFHDFLTPDGRWENVGLAVTHGPDEAVSDFIDKAHASGLDTVKVEFIHIGESDNIVWGERIDHIVTPDGQVAISVPVASVMEMTPEGRCASWREYFDGRLGEQLVAGSG